MQFTVGWNKSIFNLLKKKIMAFDEDKVCGIVFDVVYTKAGVYYNTNKDCFEELEDHGQYGNSDKVALYAMVFMIKGLATKWKQT